MIAALIALTLVPALSQADQVGVAFDRIEWRGPGATPLPPGSFQAHRMALMVQVKPTDVYPMPAYDVEGNLSPGAINEPVFTSLYRFSYLGDWTRVDDPIAMTAAIHRADLHEIIFLNLTRRTYSIVKAAPATSPSPTVSATAQAPNYKLQESHQELDPLVLDERQTMGHRVEFTYTTLAPTRSCPQGSVTFILTQYSALDIDTPVGMWWPSTFDPSDSCTTLISTETDAQSIFSKLPLYRSILVEAPDESFVRAWKRMIGFSVLPLSVVQEFGNVKLLDAADRGLFEIPAGFAEVK
ncbi:MAG TPA: hypothetical protein VKF82_11475 [Candidatus Eremiobacteraceae bacterium]|nr:hypothetical protein [Candidatus Eremiobacteraceae bacterium]